MTLLLSNDDVANLLTMPETLDALERAYIELDAGRGVNRIRSDTLTSVKDRPGAVYGLKSMDGVAPAFGVSAVRINSDIVTWPKRGNTVRREKVPAAGGRWVGLVLLFSTENGEPLAIMPDGVMQRMRVAACNGLGAKYMAREDASDVGILGSGWQAGSQLMAITSVRKVKRIRCFSPSEENRKKFAEEISPIVGVDVEPVGSPEDAISKADVVLCATNTVDPIFFEKWIEPGMHLSSLKRPEIEPAAYAKADRVAIHTNDPKPLHFSTSELHEDQEDGVKGWSALVEEVDFKNLPTLPEMIAGKYKGRTKPEEVTAFLNNLGLGYQFAAVGSVVYRKAKEQGAGTELPTEMFTQDVHP
ncbi:MAG: Ornithine cyclodeaminase 2 [Pseudomonadota bacterium]